MEKRNTKREGYIKMLKKNLISLADLEKKEILALFQLTKELKEKQKKGKKYVPLTGKTLAMIFQKPSTRTSVSFAVGMYQLGGLPLIFNVEELQLLTSCFLIADIVRSIF